MAAPSMIRGIDANTAHFTGNHAPSISIQAALELDPEIKSLVRQAEMGLAATDEDVEKASVSQVTLKKKMVKYFINRVERNRAVNQN